MKKQAKKLVLNRETLVDLEHRLKPIVGGLTAWADCGTQTCAPPYSACDFSNGQDTCISCAGNCTTNYC
jgi:hypothetical protein